MVPISFKSFGSIQQKILIAFIGITFLSLFAFGNISLYLSKKSLQEQVSMSKMRNLEVVTEKLDIMIDNVISLTNIYFGSSELRTLLMSQSVSGSYEQKLIKEFILRMIVNYKYAFTWLDYHVSIFGFNDMEIHSIYEGQVGFQQIMAEPWYRKVEQQDGNVFLLNNTSVELADVIGEDHSISVARMLKDYESGKNIGLLIISLKESFIFNQIKSSIEDYETIMLTDATGQILTASDKSLLGTTIREMSYYPETDDGKYRHSYTAEMTDGKHLVNAYRMPKTGWHFMIFSPHEHIFKEMHRVQRLIWIVFAAIVGVCMLFSFLISRKLTVPIKALYQDMKQVELGDWSVRSQIQTRDEIGFLAYRFNRMVRRIQQLHHRVIRQQEHKRRAELEALQSQINTHFLFNSLASVRYLVVTGEAQQADSVIVSLVKLLKRNFSNKSEFVTIHEEMGLLKHYLNIQQSRLENTFQVDWQVDSDIMQFRILNMLIQPIVENALFHGIEPLKQQGMIRIRGYRDDDRIVFEIIDNGVGLDGSGHVIKPHQGTGTGLKNIRNRLALHFHQDFLLKIERIDGKYTRTTVQFPIYRTETEMNNDERHTGG